MVKLSINKKKLLRAFCDFCCEECGKHEKEVGTLQIHRINRGYLNGDYVLRNIKVVCKECHKKYHFKEFRR